MLMENIVNIQEYYLIVDVVEQLIEMLGNKNRWLYVLISRDYSIKNDKKKFN